MLATLELGPATGLRDALDSEPHAQGLLTLWKKRWVPRLVTSPGLQSLDFEQQVA